MNIKEATKKLCLVAVHGFLIGNVRRNLAMPPISRKTDSIKTTEKTGQAKVHPPSTTTPHSTHPLPLLAAIHFLLATSMSLATYCSATCSSILLGHDQTDYKKKQIR